MYTADQKKFRPKPQLEIDQELQLIVASSEPVRRVFLADGDALNSARLMNQAQPDSDAGGIFSNGNGTCSGWL